MQLKDCGETLSNESVLSYQLQAAQITTNNSTERDVTKMERIGE